MTLEEIRGKAQQNFPLVYLENAESVVCLSGAITMGRTDLIHVLDQNISEVTVVDGHEEKLSKIKSVFPESWAYQNLLGLEHCWNQLIEQKATNVCIADGSRGTVDSFWENQFLLAYLITTSFIIARISGDYLEEFGLGTNTNDIEKLCFDLFGIEIVCCKLILRSSGNGGTYWAVIEGFGELAASTDAQNLYAKTQEREKETEQVDIFSNGKAIKVHELYGHGHCCEGVCCKKMVNWMRRAWYNHERTAVYRCYTSKRYLKLPSSRIKAWKNAAAIFELARFSSIDEALEAAKLTTGKKGRVNREVKKAKRNSYFVKKFNFSTYIPDIYSINTSKDERAGKKMSKDYFLSIEELGGYPKEHCEFESPECKVHFSIWYGVFKQEDGRCIGEIITNDQLVGYVNLNRSGSLARYAKILGHKDHLSYGVMYLLHFSIIEEVLAGVYPDLKYIQYGGFSSRGDGAGLQTWKKRCLFNPAFLVCDDIDDWVSPSGMKYLM